MAKRFLAFDLGAESGRAILGTVDNGAIQLETIHRFRTEGLIMLGTRQWDLARIYEEMVYALSLYVQQYGSRLDGIAVDTWGVDFGLLAEDGSLLGNPVHYRDKRNEGMQDAAFKLVPKEDVYKATGIQFLPFNTIYQLLSLVKAGAPQLKIADTLLMMGDLLGYLLTGKRACEYTNASTTQLLNPYTRTWDDELIAKLGLPRKILGNIVQPGRVLGELLPELVEKTGLSADTQVITPATHDTASAVAAVPALDNDEPWAYLSSGTWSLLGCELDEPGNNPARHWIMRASPRRLRKAPRFMR
jgi:rhamnulokinase